MGEKQERTEDLKVKKSDVSASGFGEKSMPGDKKLPANSKQNLDEKLDNAIDETFPGSDPVSVKITK